MKNKLLSELGNEISEIAVDISTELEKLGKMSIADQLQRSGTSVGANIAESTEGESIKDFIHKVSIANKELAEFEYWIRLCYKKKILIENSGLLDKINHLQRVITRLKYTSKLELERRKKIDEESKKNKKKK